MTGRSPSLQLTMATPGFKSVAAVADFIGKRRAREIVVKVLERRLGDVSESLVRKKRLMRGDDHVRLCDKRRECLVLARHVRAVLIESKILILPCQS